jgi:hypothetical protein
MQLLSGRSRSGVSPTSRMLAPDRSSARERHSSNIRRRARRLTQAWISDSQWPRLK